MRRDGIERDWRKFAQQDRVAFLVAMVTCACVSVIMIVATIAFARWML